MNSPVNSKERKAELLSIVTSEIFLDVMADLEKTAFDEFMRIPLWRRFGPKGRSLVRQMDALRNVRDRLNWLASTSATPLRKVV